MCKYIRIYAFICTDNELQTDSFREHTLEYFLFTIFSINDKQNISHYLWSDGTTELNPFAISWTAIILWKNVLRSLPLPKHLKAKCCAPIILITPYSLTRVLLTGPCRAAQLWLHAALPVQCPAVTQHGHLWGAARHPQLTHPEKSVVTVAWKGVTLMAIISSTSSKLAVPPFGASKRSAEPHTGQYYSSRVASQIAHTMHRSRLGVTSCFPSQQISEPSNKKRWFFPRVHLGIFAERPSPDLERLLTAASAGQLARVGNGNFVPTSLSQRKSAGFLSPWEAVFHLLLSAVML